MRLNDLFKMSTEEVFAAETPDEERVLVVKLNEPEMDEVQAKASAARARLMLAARDENSDDYARIHAELGELDEEGLIAHIVDDEYAKRQISIHDELAAAKEWSDDDYLEGLRELWFGTADEPGLYMTDPSGEEGVRVMGELARFNDQLVERLTAEYEDLADAWRGLDPEIVREKALSAIIQRAGGKAYTDEYLRRRTYLSVRCIDDREKLYFDSIEQFDASDKEMVKDRLKRAYNEMSVEGREGKGSPGLPGSSTSSEQPEAEPESAPSGRRVAKRSKTSQASG